MNRPIFVILSWLLASATVGIPAFAEAQSTRQWNPQALTMSRGELELLLNDLEGVASSSAYSGRIREDARRDAAQIRERLQDGDLRIGDRIVLEIQGEILPPDLPVEPGPRITVPSIGSISLQGVLRSELQEYLTAELGRFIQNPVVRAEPRIRVSIQGAVTSPGFYTVPANMLLGEALMHAGGPTPLSNIERLRVERVGETLWEGDELQSVLAEGRTLDQLNIRGGDQIVVPERATSSVWGSVLRWGLAVATSVAFGVGVGVF